MLSLEFYLGPYHYCIAVFIGVLRMTINRLFFLIQNVCFLYKPRGICHSEKLLFFLKLLGVSDLLVCFPLLHSPASFLRGRAAGATLWGALGPSQEGALDKVLSSPRFAAVTGKHRVHAVAYFIYSTFLLFPGIFWFNEGNSSQKDGRQQRKEWKEEEEKFSQENQRKMLHFIIKAQTPFLSWPY